MVVEDDECNVVDEEEDEYSVVEDDDEEYNVVDEEEDEYSVVEDDDDEYNVVEDDDEYNVVEDDDARVDVDMEVVVPTVEVVIKTGMVEAEPFANSAVTVALPGKVSVDSSELNELRLPPLTVHPVNT